LGDVVLDAAGKLGKIVVGMNKALGEIPVTVKLRMGVKDGRNNAHKLMPRLSELGAAALAVCLLRNPYFNTYNDFISAPRAYQAAALLKAG
jgi:hypothetical protein